MKTIFLACLFCAFAGQAKAQLYCYNETAKPIWLALVYNYVPADIVMVSSGDTWISEGWFYIPPNERVQLTTHIGYHREFGTKSNFFYYAEQVGGRDWYGSRAYLVDVQAERNPTQLSYRIEKAQSSYIYKDVPQLKTMPFKGATNTRDAQYTIVLRENDANEGFIKHDDKWNETFNKGEIPIIEFTDEEPYYSK
jgi:hypothetical protein